MNHKYIERNFYQRTLTFLFHIGQIILNLTNIGSIRFAKVITKWIPLSVVVEWCQYSFPNHTIKKLFNAKWLYFVISGKTIVQHTFSSKLLALLKIWSDVFIQCFNYHYLKQCFKIIRKYVKWFGAVLKILTSSAGNLFESHHKKLISQKENVFLQCTRKGVFQPWPF